MQALEYLAQHSAQLEGRVEGQRQRVASLTADVERHERESLLLTTTQATLDQLLQLMTAESVGKVERLVTYGLRTVFPDQHLTFRFEVTVKYRQPWLEPRLLHNGVEAPVLDAFGGGPATLVAFILRVVVVSRMQLAPLIMLDEVFSMVSVEGDYVDRVGLLLQELCRSLNLTILMVSHQDGFLAHADRAYRAKELPDGGTTFVPLDVGAGQSID